MRIPIFTAFLLFLAYSAFLSWSPEPEKVKTQNSAQQNQYVLERFFRASAPQQVIFLGSSMTGRLDFGRFDRCVYNMALDGDSVLTGLSAIRQSGKVPGMIFVEINVPEREAAHDLVAKASGWLPRLSPVFHTENVPINRLFSFLYQLRPEKPEGKVSEKAFQIAFETRRRAFETLLAADLLDRNLAELARTTSDLRTLGARIVFFEMPMHPGMESSPRAEQIRTAFRRAFPQADFLGYQELSRNLDIKTKDGIHLYPGEAREVVRNLEPSFADACK